MLSSLKKTIAPGFYCKNESDVPILFVMSQLSPLHWVVVQPGECKHLNCGRVFFTISVDPYVGDEPTIGSVAGRIGIVVAASILLPVISVGFVGAFTGITSVLGVKKDGVLANGRVAVIRGQTIATKQTYQLYFSALDKLDTEDQV